ncbi:MAG TPA: glycine betaine ABC transporter substrate-binding protein [Burkholderiaceae bacterium]|nr:glycine betaine ABC transporter substrate-binding protein [Burkholderiaceae bacterium]
MPHKRSWSSVLFVALLTLTLPGACAAGAQEPAAKPGGPIVVGSKRFTESYVLGEIVRQTLQRQGLAAEHKQGLGNTGILDAALASGAVDLYPEYTGTIVRELLKRTPDPAHPNPSLAELNEWLAPRGLKAAVPLGFNNTYALAMLESRAQALHIERISDLLKPEAAALTLGFSHEFLQRADGWPALKAAYKLTYAPPSGLDHGLAYDAVAAGRVDLIDIYSTDAKVGRYHLRVLQDDLGFFPRYDAVLLMRRSVDERPLKRLEGAIDATQMIALNAQAELDGMSFDEVARRFLDGPASTASTGASAASGAAPESRAGFWPRLFAPDFTRLALQHLLLVFGSLAAAVAVGVPIGIAAWRWPRMAAWLLGLVAVLQTVPSLALLAFLIALVGSIGFVPAVIALFLYALLPIVRNTHAGLHGVALGLAQAGASLGLTRPQVLRYVQLPLALPTLLAGVKTAAVINVGTATVAAFIGAGGFGERIVSGLAVNDTGAMLAGALPAAVLALLVQWLFDLVERRWLRGSGSPQGLRQSPDAS